MKIPTPQELGLPDKFDSFRPSQIEALQWLLGSQRRTKALSMPTGSGKSLVYVAYALIIKEPTCIVTDSRALQDQLMADFEPVGLVDLRGRRNYDCPLKPEYSCEQGYQASCPYKGTLACASSAAEMRASTSYLVVTNYDKWTSAKKFGKGMDHFTSVVFDEGHEAPNALGRAMQVTIHHPERERHIALDPPLQPDDMSQWKPWAVDARATVEAELKRALNKIRGVGSPQSSHIRHALHMRNLNRRLGTLSTCNPANWIVEEIEGKGFQFDPVRPGRYAESALLLRVPNVLVISATLRPKTLFLIGQGADTFDYREFDSEFDPKRCPVYWVPTMRVDSRAYDLSMLWMRLDQVASKRRDRRGLVHTISYVRQQAAMETSRFRDSMFLNVKGDAPTEMIEAYKVGPVGSILVSPSIGQGHDFAGPAAEWQFICKLPFPPPSKILKARTEDDKEYPYYLTMQKFVQMVGRIMRFKEDQGETFIPDDHVEWFINRYRHLAPRSFNAVFSRADVLPKPPPPLAR